MNHPLLGRTGLSLAAGLLLIDPKPVTDIIGITIVALIVIWQVFQKKNAQKNQQLKAA